MLKRFKNIFKNKSGQISNLPILVKVLISIILGASVLGSLCFVSIDAMNSANNEVSSVFETIPNTSDGGHDGKGEDVSSNEPGITYTDRGFVPWDTVIEENPSAFSNGDYSFIIGIGGDPGATSLFKDYKKIEKVVLPSTIKEIGMCSFGECSSLKSITIPNSVSNIDYFAFYNCTSLTSVTIPKGVKFIDTGAFSSCISLKNITIPNSVTNIKSDAFGGCTSLVDIVIPDSITSIENNTFTNCTSLKDITIGSSVTSIGSSVFEGCSSLTSIIIPNSVTSISYSVFKGCTSLTSITVGNKNENYCDINGVLFTKDKTKLIRYPVGKNETSYVIPDGVTIVDSDAFEGCTLKSVTMSDSVTNIYSNFSRCESLTNISVNSNNKNYCDDDGVLFNKDKTKLIQYPIGKTATYYVIPNNTTTIDGSAFACCKSLKTITIPNSVTSIGVYAFEYCDSLTSITVPNGLKNIQGGVFGNCTSLINVTIPDSITKISYETFENCTSLKDVFYNGTEEQWKSINILGSNDCLKNANIYYGNLFKTFTNSNSSVVAANNATRVVDEQNQTITITNGTSKWGCARLLYSFEAGKTYKFSATINKNNGLTGSRIYAPPSLFNNNTAKWSRYGNAGDVLTITFTPDKTVSAGQNSGFLGLYPDARSANGTEASAVFSNIKLVEVDS